MITIEKSWAEKLQEEIGQSYIKDIKNFLEKERLSGATIYPEEKNIFRALLLTPFSQVKVVILGQDPYHGPQQAHGLAFSVLPSTALPPSLKNIFKELQSSFGSIPSTGCLEGWAKQGVLLLNTVLTVRAKEPFSHREKGWENLTDAMIRLLAAEKERPLVFMLWGKAAQQKAVLISSPSHLVLTAAHPSPYSAHAFFGCNHFSLCNKFLIEQGEPPIDWSLSL